MDMRYVTGRCFSSNTSGYKDAEGEWTISVVMTETLVFPNGTSREERVESLRKDKSFDDAHKAAMKDVLQILQDLVYSRGFDSLIEAMDYKRSLEAGNDSKAEADEAPASE